MKPNEWNADLSELGSKRHSPVVAQHQGRLWDLGHPVPGTTRASRGGPGTATTREEMRGSSGSTKGLKR